MIDKKSDNRFGNFLLVVILLVLMMGVCGRGSSGNGGGGGRRVSSPEATEAWDIYYGCRIMREGLGYSDSESYEFCEKLRP